MAKTKEVIIGISVFSLLLLFVKNQSARNSKPKIYLRKNLNGYNARTLPPFGIYILEKEKNNKALLNHELIHWKQYQKLGLIKYYSQYYSQYKKYGYDKMPMEIEARTSENNYCKTSYTHCVRNGTAKTVQNKNFRK